MEKTKAIGLYKDYRHYLRDRYQDLKKSKPHFSHRYISQKCHLKSSGAFSLILTGKVNVSTRVAQELAKIFCENNYEREYFECLVSYNQAETAEEQARYFEKMLQMEGKLAENIQYSQLKFFSKVHYVVIRELLEGYPNKGDFKDIQRILKMDVSLEEIQATVSLLEELKLIKRGEEYWEKSSLLMTTESIWEKPIQDFQMKLLQYSLDHYEASMAEGGEYSSLTLGVSRETFLKIIKRLKEFRKELMGMAKQDDKETNVYNINFNCIPLAVRDET